MIERALAGVWTLALPALGPDSGLLAVAVFTAAAVLLAVVQLSSTAARRPLSSPLPARASAARANSRRTAYLLLCDPDAAGRPRPRAPGR
ncbi:DUF6412 domain-containing protein [Kribbella sp. CA-293567]|uniref:DUF6412 domain-containing protein n=1 Tax=Kribbella sp. CA-293567 TaxID=3002436 RepID=UPI0022DD666D|nr:DUF6412 domain-containing protein [Kribbella sp. CA-293567]WBQ02039.1 DUF6412 domain-containing protein [Kribbella sp. CA-293567]